MHAVFLLYGIKQKVDHFLMDVQAEKFQWKFWKEGEPDKIIWIQGSLRLMPFGFYDYVFPKESLDIVLTTLDADKPTPYFEKENTFRLGGTKLKLIRKFLKLKEIPKYNNEKKFLWVKENVAIIPIGIKEDCDFIETSGNFIGWRHEML